MARTTRSSVLLWLQDVFGMQSGAEQPPVEIAKDLQPVVEVGPRFSKLVRSTSRSTTTTGTTIYTTPSDKDFYLTHLHLSVTKDVNCDNVIAQIFVPTEGANRSVLPIATQTLTAGSWVSNLTFPYPIKVDRNAVIALSMSFTAGNMTCYASLGGFILE